MRERLQHLRTEIAARTIPVLPESTQAKIVGSKTTWKHKDLRQVAKAEPADTRLLIGPTNYAGQGYLWAQAATTLQGVSAQSLQYYDPKRWFRFPSDTHVRTNVWGYSHLWKRRQWEALEGFTHVLVEAGRPLIPGGEWALGDEDIEELQARGLKVGLLWHGTDVRLPSRHMELEPYSPYRGGDPGWVEELERLAQANHDLADRWALPEFVSNPYLKAFRPDATWIPTLSIPEKWNAAPVADDGHVPVVADVPSQRIWKGTDVIRPILGKLQDEGLLRYLDITNVSPEDMPATIASADIVVDGIVNGQYGVVSLEAMLSRRVAVAHTWETTRADIHEQSGLQVPAVEADPDSFEDVVRGLISDPDRRRQLGESGRDYVLSVHGQSRAASALEGFLRT